MRDVGRLRRVGHEDAVLGHAAIERGQERQCIARRRATTCGRRAVRRRGRPPWSARARAPRGRRRWPRAWRAASPCRPTAASPLALQLAGVDVDAHERARELAVPPRRARRSSRSRRTRCRRRARRRPRRRRRARAAASAWCRGSAGWLSGTTPLALTVMPTGAPRRSATAVGLGARGHGAAAEQQHRASRPPASSSTARSTSAASATRGRPARRQPLRGGAGQVEHVDRDADVHGPRAPRLEDLEGPGERLGQLGRVADVDRLGRDRGHERALVGQVVQRAVPAAVVARSPWRSRSRASGSSRGRRRRSAWRRS